MNGAWHIHSYMLHVLFHADMHPAMVMMLQMGPSPGFSTMMQSRSSSSHGARWPSLRLLCWSGTAATPGSNPCQSLHPASSPSKTPTLQMCFCPTHALAQTTPPTPLHPLAAAHHPLHTVPQGGCTCSYPLLFPLHPLCLALLWLNPHWASLCCLPSLHSLLLVVCPRPGCLLCPATPPEDLLLPIH